MAAAGQVAPRDTALHRAGVSLTGSRARHGRGVVRHPVHRPLSAWNLHFRGRSAALVAARARVRVPPGHGCLPAVPPFGLNRRYAASRTDSLTWIDHGRLGAVLRT